MGSEPFDSAQLLRGALDLAVLSVIATGEAYGYDIARRIWSSGLPEVREASIYGTVNRLFRNGLLTARVEASPAGPHRKYYGLTVDGADYLRGGQTVWYRTRTALDTLLDAALGDQHPATQPSAADERTPQ